jgi:penicillin-binding protein 1A
MDISVQKQLTAYFENTANFPRECQTGLSYAMVVCDPYTGDLLGIISSIGEKKENRILNYGADVLRAPGSALKPLSVYAPAIEENLITWSTVFDDVPLRFKKEAGTYTAWPHNAPLVYSGLTDVQDAVALSKNTVAVRILERLGAERAYGYLEKLGIDTLVRSRATAKGQRVTDLATAPMALGQLSDGVSVRALTNAYGALANGGEYRTSRSYSLVLDGQGKPLLQKKVTGKRVFSRQTASMMTELLHGVCTYGTAKHLRLDDMVDTAGKTGTSSESRDKWFVGYTPYYTAGIWCGYADGSSPVPDSLSQTHLATWDAIMQQLHRPYTAHGEERTFSVASGLVRRSYCKDSGLLPCEACRKDPRGDRITEGYFKAGTEPRRTCDCHVTVLYDKDGGGIAREGCPHTSVEEIAMLRLPARQFPVEVYVTDAQFGYRDLGEASPSYESGKPFYANLLMPGDHVGLSRTGNGKQFNCMCPAHGDEPQETDEALPDKKYPFDWFARYFSRFAGNTA